MAGIQVFLVAALATVTTAAPQRSLSQSYLPPPETPPPETYLPPPVTEPSPEYLPPSPTEPSPEYLPPSPTEPSGEYLPPPAPPSSEYLPPARGHSATGGATDTGDGEDSQTDGSAVEQDCGESDGSNQLDARSSGGGCSTGDVSSSSQSEDAQQSDQRGQFDDGQYRPSGNSGQYDPNAGRPSGDDGSYRLEPVTFAPIEDFEFAYAVKDEESGNDYAVNESNKGGAYKVKLPDGRTQIVQYVIDSRGIYRSKISYLQADESQ